jgi:hypothetical protein
MSKWIGIVTLAGATCLMVGLALAQSQVPSAQTPTEKDMRSESGQCVSSRPRRHPCQRSGEERVRTGGTRMSRRRARIKTSRLPEATRTCRHPGKIRTCSRLEAFAPEMRETTRTSSLRA